MTLPSALEGLPPLPKGLRGALALQAGWRELDKVHALKTAIQQDLAAGKDLEGQERQKSLQGSLTQLRKDMVSLRQLDLSLLCQLLRLYENIQDWKQMMSDQPSLENYDYALYNGTIHQSYDVIKENVTKENGIAEQKVEEPIYENTPVTRPSFWNTRRKCKTPDRDPSRSPAMDNPDFEESMLGPTSTPRRLSRHHNMDVSLIPRYLPRTSTGSNGLGATETLAWLASGSPARQSGSSRHTSTCSSSGSLEKSHNWPSGSPHPKSQCTPEVSPNRNSAPTFEQGWSPIKRHGSVSTESDESLYLEPLPCVHAEHRRIWKQNAGAHHDDGSAHHDEGSAHHNNVSAHHNCSGMSGYERQLSANSSYLYESTC